MPRGVPKRVGVKVNLGLVELSGEWEPNDIERAAAWELYIELVTRVSVVPLGPDQGSLREALTSLYTIFATTRDVLRRRGPELAEAKPGGQYNFAYLALTILNTGIRPLLQTGRAADPGIGAAVTTNTPGPVQLHCAWTWKPPARH
jgi:hypothetical protein